MQGNIKLSFYAKIETEYKESLMVIRPDGTIAGKSLLYFIEGIEEYCSKQLNSKGNMARAFSQLEKNTSMPICELLQVFINSYYVGDWDYEEDEYDFFLHRNPSLVVSREDFSKTLLQINERWVDLKKLLWATNQLLKIIMQANLEQPELYDFEDIIADVKGLINTLTFFDQRDVDEVRIKFI
ncbi:MAG TPA: hypothetical protein VLL52_23395 [Anaerolineae bacterium]|nr:hypothetical protein [Anaerolineae bacterium]